MSAPVREPPVIGAWRPGDEASICRRFRRVFGKEKSLAHWRWQFLEPDGGPHVVVARDAQGEVVAHFGCVPRRALVDGAELVFANSVDSMVAPEHRAGLQRRGLFARVVDRYVELFGRPEHEAVGYGLPNREAARIGRRLLGYEPVVDLMLLVRDPAPGNGAASGVRLEESGEPAADHHARWARVRPRMGVGAVRDRRALAWRFARCPGGAFRFVSARRRGELQAVAIYKPTSMQDGCASLADLLWAGDDEESLAACLRRVEVLAHVDGRSHVVALLPQASREARLLAARGYRPVASGLPLVARCYRPDLQAGRLRAAWWYTFGDFDLV